MIKRILIATIMLMALLVPAYPANAEAESVTCRQENSFIGTTVGVDNPPGWADYNLRGWYTYKYCVDTEGPNYFIPLSWHVSYKKTNSQEGCHYNINSFTINIGAVGTSGQYDPNMKTLFCAVNDPEDAKAGSLDRDGVIFTNDPESARCFRVKIKEISAQGTVEATGQQECFTAY